jgi:hypothetical protein
MENKSSSPFGITGPLTEVLLIVNLAIRGHSKEVSGEIEYQIALYNYYGIMKT